MTPTSPATRTCRAALAARVVSTHVPCRAHVRIDVDVDDFPPSTPGQFLQLACRAGDDPAPRPLAWDESRFPTPTLAEFYQPDAFLRRPFSIADRCDAPDGAADGAARLSIISRDVGPGTHWLAGLQAGDTLDLTGPLGSGFRLPTRGTALVLIGGGVGIPPLLYLARAAAAAGHADVTAIFGATSGDLLPLALREPPAADGAARPCVVLPADAPFPAIVTTDDGSLGLPGRVTDALARWAAARDPGSPATVFACGPEAMLHAIARQTRRLGLDCQLCIEKLMGCGLGTCLSCVVRRVEPSRPAGWRWALSCSEGPVFERDELLEFAEG